MTQILATDLWNIRLYEDQAYLGRCVISLNRDCTSLSEVTDDEFVEFHQIVKKLETALKKSFNATMFNWTCLMNNAYKKEPPKPWVHWHFRPRYNQQVEFENEIFEDPEFAQHYSRERKRIVSAKFLEKIASRIKENL